MTMGGTAAETDQRDPDYGLNIQATGTHFKSYR